jgi:hypothetical protein
MWAILAGTDDVEEAASAVSPLEPAVENGFADGINCAMIWYQLILQSESHVTDYA